MAVKLVVGLGNPGSEYQQTRHNVGADFVSALAEQGGQTLQAESKFHGLAGRINFSGHDLRLLIPTTFMNRSGRAVAAIAQFYKIPVGSILIAHDELDIPAGTARFKLGGGHGGHNGLRDIIPALGNDKEFYRLRIGISHPGHASKVSGHVLSRPSHEDRNRIDDALNASINALPLLLAGDMNKAMSELHSFSAA